eukprot:4645405-Karenia_brevis.AAC.1
MPSLGLRFSLLEVIPAAGENTSVDTGRFAALGCTVNTSRCVSVMKSPIGTAQYCAQESAKRIAKAEKVIRAIAALPDRHWALYLLRYQTGRMDYLMRTTPPECCKEALLQFDALVKFAYEYIVGETLTQDQWTQACLPT